MLLSGHDGSFGVGVQLLQCIKEVPIRGDWEEEKRIDQDKSSSTQKSGWNMLLRSAAVALIWWWFASIATFAGMVRSASSVHNTLTITQMKWMPEMNGRAAVQLSENYFCNCTARDNRDKEPPPAPPKMHFSKRACNLGNMLKRSSNKICCNYFSPFLKKQKEII